MRRSSALDRFALDGARHSALAALNADTANAWRASREGAWVSAIIAEASAVSDESARLDALAPLFADAGWITAFARHWLAALARDELLELPHRSFASAMLEGVALHDDARLTLSLTSLDSAALNARGPAGSIDFSSGEAMLRFLRPAGVRIERFVRDGERARPADILAPAAECMIRLDLTRESIRFLSAETDPLMLRAHAKCAVPPRVRRHDVATGRLIALSSGSSATSRTQMALLLLDSLDDPRTDAVCREQSEASAPELRWHAMRLWLSRDFRAAHGRLRTMAERDDDEAVRRAAQASLALVEARL